MTPKTIPAVEARVHLGKIMKLAFKKGERFIVEKSGIPMVVILNAVEYAHLIQEREERFKILDRIKANLPNIPSREVEEDVSKTIQKIRKRHV
ncbi:MAG: type II toxin-antitoxin system Phd/YefM family antitoxin [Candidatus Omnitrophota bacterium]